MKTHTAISYTLSLIAAALLLACGEKDQSEDSANAADDTSIVQTPSGRTDSTADSAEIDRIVNDYYTASDSLATVFSQINTVEDVTRFAESIKGLNQRLSEFNRQTTLYGQVVIDRMEQPDLKTKFDSVVNRLIAQRDRLGEKPEVYQKIQEIESSTIPDQTKP